jgi:hypothetical protein
MFNILCNGNKIAQKHTEQEAQRFADERKVKFPKSEYTIEEVKPDAPKPYKPKFVAYEDDY